MIPNNAPICRHSNYAFQALPLGWTLDGQLASAWLGNLLYSAVREGMDTLLLGPAGESLRLRNAELLLNLEDAMIL